tara:strand:+ start:19144 stop:19461 length:318 start_codon:yes stop_codon:yes gene_type:complete
MQYYDRYSEFHFNGEHKVVPAINIAKKSSDIVVSYKKGVSRLDKFSQQYYGTPFFNWLILQANPQYGGLEWNIPDGDTIIIPFPLVPTLEEYKTKVDEYYYYYGR